MFQDLFKDMKANMQPLMTVADINRKTLEKMASVQSEYLTECISASVQQVQALAGAGDAQVAAELQIKFVKDFEAKLTNTAELNMAAINEAKDAISEVISSSCARLSETNPFVEAVVAAAPVAVKKADAPVVAPAPVKKADVPAAVKKAPAAKKAAPRRAAKPKAAAPKAAAPKDATPKAATPKAAAPKVETVAKAAPKVEAPKAPTAAKAAPKVEAPKAPTAAKAAPKATPRAAAAPKAAPAKV